MKEKLLSQISRLENSEKGKWLVQFIKFGMVGVTNTLISLGITYLVQFIFFLSGTGIDNRPCRIISTAVGFIAGVINSFVLNRKYVFKSGQEQEKRKLFVRVFICYGGTYLLSVFIMEILFVKVFLVGTIVATLLRYLITIPLNFIANKLWAFKDR